jgi:hypothetical protein
MMDKPAKFKKEFPVVESRFDDFVALHVNVSLGGMYQQRMSIEDMDIDRLRSLCRYSQGSRSGRTWRLLFGWP